MSRIFKKIPITIHPFFWVIVGVIAWFNTQASSKTFAEAFIWVLVIVLSVLVHEMGHAVTASFFGQNPKIILMAFGGATTYENKDLKFWQQFLVVLNGPLMGIFLFFLATLILYLNFFQNVYVLSFLETMQIVNLFWTVVNLLPVLPLDGGQLVRIILEAAFGIKGFKLSLFFGMMVALALCLFFFITNQFLIGALFFLFAFQSFDMWRKSKFLTQADRNSQKTSLLMEGEKALAEGKKEEAKQIFEKIRQTTKRGLLFTSATNYLAVLKLEEKQKSEAFQLLLEIQDQLPDENKCLLHQLAFEEKQYPIVAKYSSFCYQRKPSFEIALKNAQAFAFLKQAKLSGGWLQTASQYEQFNLAKILEDNIFEKVKDNKKFKKFIDQIKN